MKMKFFFIGFLSTIFFWGCEQIDLTANDSELAGSLNNVDEINYNVSARSA